MFKIIDRKSNSIIGSKILCTTMKILYYHVRIKLEKHLQQVQQTIVEYIGIYNIMQIKEFYNTLNRSIEQSTDSYNSYFQGSRHRTILYYTLI